MSGAFLALAVGCGEANDLYCLDGHMTMSALSCSLTKSAAQHAFNNPMYSGTVVGIADAAGQLLAQAVYVSSYMPPRKSILSSTHELVDKHLRRRTKSPRALGTINRLSCLRAMRMNQTEMSESFSPVLPLRGRQIATPVQQRVLLLSQYQAVQHKEYSLPSSSQEAQGELTADLPLRV